MGGIGSGARRSTHIGNVEEMLALDIRKLRRLGVVRPGECICDTVRWSIDGLSALSARLRIDLSDIERGGVMAISGEMPCGAIAQHVAIEIVPSPFGGHRCYFICPNTGRRCEVIYYARGRFASRAAQRLSYAVQGMDEAAVPAYFPDHAPRIVLVHHRLAAFAPVIVPRLRLHDTDHRRLPAHTEGCCTFGSPRRCGWRWRGCWARLEPHGELRLTTDSSVRVTCPGCCSG